MRSTRSHTAKRRLHHALKKGRLTLSKEGVTHPRHRALLDGSVYRGRSVMDLGAKRITRRQKAEKRARIESGTPQEQKAEEKEETKK